MWIRQSTVTVIQFGPFLDKGNGADLESGAGIITSIDDSTTGIMLSKNGGALAVREQGANFVASTYDAHGCFKVSLSAIDTGTLGRLRVIHTEPATYLPVWQDFMIVPANVWDSMFGADKLDVNVAEQANIDFGALQKASLDAITLSGVVEGAITLKQAVQAILAFSAGIAVGGGTTAITFRDQADSKDRIAMTVDANGNRTDVSLDLD